MDDCVPSAEPNIDSSKLNSKLNTVLTQLGLDQYEQCLRDNGFEDWKTLITITEVGMAELSFNLGDRRKLQPAIRENGTSSVSHRICDRTIPFYYLKDCPPLGGRLN